jgi:hypothetical protein
MDFEVMSTSGHELDVETSSLEGNELEDLLAENRRHSDSGVTRTLAGDELSELLAASRHRSMATIPDVNAELFAKEEGRKSEPTIVAPPAAKPPPGQPLKIMALIEEEIARPSSSPVVDEGPTLQMRAARPPPPRAMAPPPPAPAPAPAKAPPSPGAWAMGKPDIAIGRPGLSSLTEWAGAPLRPKRTRQIIMIGAGAAVLAIALAFILTDSEPSPEPTSTPSAVEAPAPPPPPPAKTAAPGPSQAEIDARAALTKLREGMGDCIRHGVGTLPGSSPVIPATLKMTKAPGYMPTPSDWKTAVWVCARFRVTSLMQFQVQWQLVKPGAEGLGVAWIDENGDGIADRALGFRTTLRGRRDPILGEIGPIDAAQGGVATP